MNKTLGCQSFIKGGKTATFSIVMELSNGKMQTDIMEFSTYELAEKYGLTMIGYQFKFTYVKRFKVVENK